MSGIDSCTQTQEFDFTSRTRSATDQVRPIETSRWTWSGIPRAASRALPRSEDAADVGVQARLPLRHDQRLAVLGAEYDVTEQRGQGLWHGGSPVRPSLASRVRAEFTPILPSP